MLTMTIKVIGYIGALGYIGHRGRSKHQRGKTIKSRRKKKTKREMFKCSNVHWYNFSTRIARTLLYKGSDKLGESQKLYDGKHQVK